MSERLSGLYLKLSEPNQVEERAILQQLGYGNAVLINDTANLYEVHYNREYFLNNELVFTGLTAQNYFILIDQNYSSIIVDDETRIESQVKVLNSIFPNMEWIKLFHYDTADVYGFSLAANSEVRSVTLLDEEVTAYGNPIAEEQMAQDELRNNPHFRDYFFFKAGLNSSKENKNKDYQNAKKKMEELVRKRYVLGVVSILSGKVFGERWLGPLDESLIRMKVFRKSDK